METHLGDAAGRRVWEELPLRVNGRRSGIGTATLAAVAAGVLGTWPGVSAAQRGGYGMGGAGSTFQGDVLRGEGIAAWGFGQYNLATAMATSINVDTSIRWNQYVYLSLMEDLRLKAIHREAHKQRNNANYQAILARKKVTPDQADLRNGDALNIVLTQLLDPRISPSNYRKAVVPLPGDTVRKIPFHYAQRAATFSMERLEVKSPLDWPVKLRDPEFAGFRKEYKLAVDAAIEHDHEGKLSSADIDRIKKAVDDLDLKIEQVIRQSQTTDFVQAKNHVKRLSEVPRMFRERAIERVILEIETYPGTSVGDLIAFMQKHNLRFGVADSATENELYAALFDSLVQQREQLTLPPEPEQPNR